MDAYILTHGRSNFDFQHPEEATFGIYDIAHALSNTCRFAGHCREFYSVAQHSVLVSHIVPPEDAMAGLLHDAAEAFLGDVTMPLKQLLPDYRALEKRVEAVVFARFGLPPVLPPSVKAADMEALATEDRDLMPPHGDTWPCLRGVAPLSDHVHPLLPYYSRQLFINRYRELSSLSS